MRGLVRLLIMFGPMIMRQVGKFQRNRQRQQPQRRNNQIPEYNNRRRQAPNQHGANQGPQRGQQQPVVYKDLNKELGRDGRGRAVSAEERDFNLKDEDIMLSKDDLKHFEEHNRRVEELDDVSLEPGAPKKNTAKKADEDSDYDEFFES